MNSHLATISDSNYSCEYLSESFLRMKNKKDKEILKLNEKEKKIYNKEEQFSKRMMNLITNRQKGIKSKYNKIKKERELYHVEYNNINNKIFDLITTHRNIFDFNYNKKWIFPKEENNLDDQTFQKKCKLKSCNKIQKKNGINKDKKNNIIFENNKIKTYRKSIDYSNRNRNKISNKLIFPKN